MLYKLMRAIGILFCVFAFGYLVGSFMAWEFDPGKWDTAERAMGGFVFAAIGLGAAIVVELESRP